MIPRFSLGMLSSQDPHFYLQIFLDGGADSSYLFDARPMEMTTANLMQNYNAEEPMMIMGSNGTTAYTPNYNKSLLTHFDRFSILNGVHMAMTFDGHGQNADQLFTGSPFGGESFIPHLNMERSNHRRTPVDCIRSGFMFSNVTNDGSTVPLNPESTGPLVKLLNDLPKDSGDPELNTFINERIQANAAGQGRFSLTTRAMMDAIEQMPNLHQQLEKIPPPDAQAEGDTKFVQFLNGLFQNKVAQSAVLIVSSSNNQGFDNHDAAGAKNQPAAFAQLSERLKQFFDAMKATPFDSTNSLLDVTTVMISSEFTRTMRQDGSPITETGTDHNPFTNSLIIGGKGIRAGQIFGASDFAVSTEALSGAHKQLDPKNLRLMGRPFDFNGMIPRTDLPSAYVATDYLNVDSVVNTIYECFGIPSTMHRLQDRNGPPAPLLKTLLS